MPNLPKPQGLDPASEPPVCYLILEEKPNPSTDYFVLGAINDGVVRPDQATDTNHDNSGSNNNTHQNPKIQIQRLTWGEPLSQTQLRGAHVVVVRYLTDDWRKAIEQHRQELGSLTYFFDDDIPDVKASRGLPLKYRYKLYRYGARHFDWLSQQNASLWVSTP